jgi:hypothetical protein
MKKQSPRTLELYFHSDPGHGWLEINRHLLPDSVLASLSQYSYQSPNGGTTIYAEEDCDMPKVLQHFKDEGYEVTINELSFDCDHVCRKYPSFKHQ